MDMSTNLEIVVSPDEGRVVRMGVTKTSGVTAFDVAALESVSRAQPFGTPPKEIISPDGNVYLHWEFYRNPDYACSTYFARPFMLKAKPQTAPPAIAPPPTPPTDEGPPDRERHGEIPRDRSGVHALR
jgi:TonB family protein